MIDENLLIKKLDKIKNKLINSNKVIASNKGYFVEKIIEIVKNEPKVGEWIPCSDRLPKQDKLLQDYLVTFEYYRFGIYHRRFKTIGIGTFDRLNQKFTFINGQTGWRDLKVLAWQPLPELYKGGVESD